MEDREPRAGEKRRNERRDPHEGKQQVQERVECAAPEAQEVHDTGHVQQDVDGREHVDDDRRRDPERRVGVVLESQPERDADRDDQHGEQAHPGRAIAPVEGRE